MTKANSEEDLIHVVWEGPFTPDEVRRREAPDDRGIYQTIGVHLVFGPGSLLYVGSTAKQTFAQRFQQHIKNGLESESEIQIRLGTIAAGDRPAALGDYLRLISDVEALTIYWHSPPYNSRNIVSPGARNLRIHNLGKRGVLHPEYSTQWQASWRPIDG